MAHHVATIRGRRGEALPKALITVFEAGTSNLADLFSDVGQTAPLANPLLADDKGIVDFYLANGVYDLLTQRFDIEDLLIENIAMGESVVAVTLAGDVTGTSGATVVESIQGNPVAPGVPDDGDALIWDGIPGPFRPMKTPLSGDVEGDSGASSVTAIQGTSVSAVAPASEGDILVYDQAQAHWEPRTSLTIAGDVANNTDAAIVVGLRGVDLAAAMSTPSDGDLMQYDFGADEWVPVPGNIGDLQAAVAALQLPDRFILTPGQMSPGGSTLIQTVSGHGVATLAGGGGQISQLGVTFVLPPAYYGIDLKIVAYVTKEGISSETIHLDAGFADVNSGTGLDDSTNFLVSPQIAPHEIVFPGTHQVTGGAPGQLVELAFRRNAGDAGDENGEPVNLYTLAIQPA